MLHAALVHSLPGRARFRVPPPELRGCQTEELGQYLSGVSGVNSASVNPLSGSILIYYDEGVLSLSGLAALVGNLDLPPRKIGKEELAEPRRSPYSFAAGQLFRLFCPPQIRPLLTVFTALSFFYRGLKSLAALRMDVPLLDASAIGLSLLDGDYRSASTLMALLKTGEYLEEWAKYRSRANLAEKLSFTIGNVWVRREDGDAEIPASQLEPGDRVVIRTGAMIPVDGRVVSGSALVNEASMTGEALAAFREADHSVHAGTVVEEGEIVVEARKKAGDTRFQKILALIAQSEAAKAGTELKAYELADRLVPFSFLIAGGTAVLGGGLAKARAVLSVDYSCPIKLSTPLVFLAAMREGLNNGIFFKGGASLEALASVDTIVFDKTGTLTRAAPALDRIIVYNGFKSRNALRIAACMEEHFPHPVAKSILRYANEQGVKHREDHSSVTYIAAHGIVTAYQGKRTVIGSRHFISEDERIDISIAQGDEAKIAAEGKSLLYLAVDGVLAAVFVIDDPPREEGPEVIAMLRALGIRRIYLLSGDNQRTTEGIAKRLGVDSFRGELLPDEKTAIVKALRDRGLAVAMVGDGLNDSPAMSAATVGIAMKEGADLSREVAGITLRAPSLYPLVAGRLIAERAMKKIRSNIVLAAGINSALMLTGILGNRTGSASMVLHNLTTLMLSLNSMRPLLGREARP
ncbi:MAG: heavy metal translocating P-type ATPase [Spirochaetaceae bacterium]|jgi:heavy metal translocating P-type ATPase|nr:heavy metal translocating P-type ATPase [Spirochaetaceae bacterium]